MLVRLARHRAAARRVPGKRSRFGPLHALRELLSMPAAEIVEAVLWPEPTWVPCEGSWHRVLLRDGRLTALEHGEIDLESERVAAVLGRTRLTGCAAAVAEWEGRRNAVRLPWVETLASFDAAATYDDLPMRDAWIEARVSASAVASAGALGIEDIELLRWVPWLRCPERIAAWRVEGWCSRDAWALRDLSLSPALSIPWRDAGLDLPLIGEAIHRAFSPESAGAWWKAGFTLKDADLLIERELDLPCAVAQRAALGSTAAVMRRFAP